MKKTFNLNELDMVADEVIAKIGEIATDTALIVALSGDLGAGKTALTQKVAAKLGVKEHVISPTFVILKNYKTEHDLFKNLVHIDAYRLDSSMELVTLGWIEIVKDKNNLIVLEWPEKVPECLKENNVCHIKLTHIDEETRQIEFV